jgi:MFS family permease
MTAAELLVQVPTAFAASALFALGGYPLVGWVSVAVCLAAALLALRFPEAPRVPDRETSLVGALRQGVREAVSTPGLRLTVLAVALVGALDAVEEYFPVLAFERGVPVTVVPVAVLVVALAGALGAALGGRAERLPDGALPVLLAVAGLCLAAAVALPAVAALAAVAVFYALYLAVLVVAQTRLQDRIDSPHRATITSVAGLGIELGSLLVFAAWAMGGAVAVAGLVLVVAPVTVAGLRQAAGHRADGQSRDSANRGSRT